MKVLGIDAGTTETGYCIIDGETYRPLMFGKIPNAEMLNVIKAYGEDEDDKIMAIEGFACYGMPIGQTTIEAITWNGRYIQLAEDNAISWDYVYRKDEKMLLCGSMKAKDANIRQALIDRFGGVGTKKEPGWFYGFAGDMWAAYAIATVQTDRIHNRSQ